MGKTLVIVAATLCSGCYSYVGHVLTDDCVNQDGKKVSPPDQWGK